MGKLLVLLETDGATLPQVSTSAISFAQELSKHWDTEFDLLALGGPGIAEKAEAWREYGAECVWCVEQPELKHPTADVTAAFCVRAIQHSTAGSLVGSSTTFIRDVLPRAAELLGLPMVSDISAIDLDTAKVCFRRAMYAGNILATIELEQPNAVFSVRSSSFRDPKQFESQSDLRQFKLEAETLPSGSEWVSLEAAARQRPELTSARAVVSGGRPLRDAETFEKLLGGLADALGGAVGATRAAVDSGIAPNELQVGQTGKVVAPELYIAAGVSGSVQHLAGMKDSRVIVAINTDPDAPIFSVADFGLVADLHKAIPELIEAVKSEQRK